MTATHLAALFGLLFEHVVSSLIYSNSNCRRRHELHVDSRIVVEQQDQYYIIIAYWLPHASVRARQCPEPAVEPVHIPVRPHMPDCRPCLREHGVALS